MTMTQIQRDALTRAKAGDWTLADAIELKHRMENDPDICGGYRENERLRLLVEGEISTCCCDDCNGRG